MKDFDVKPNFSDFGERLMWGDFDKHPECRGMVVDWNFPPAGLGSMPLLREECVALIDALWRAGYRPSKDVAPSVHVNYKHEQELAEKDVAKMKQEVANLSYHLEDMRHIAFSGLDLKRPEEPK